MIEEGWCQKLASMVDNDGRIYRCIGEAIKEAARMLGVSCIDAENLFIQAIGCLNNDIPNWNDQRERKKEHVLAAIDKALAS
jgi:hypothetical protein